jgi:hypothetical protein
MTRVAGVFGNFKGLSLTPPGIEVLDGRKLGPGDVLGRNTHCCALRSEVEQLPFQAVIQPDALDGAAVEL